MVYREASGKQDMSARHREQLCRDLHVSNHMQYWSTTPATLCCRFQYGCGIFRVVRLNQKKLLFIYSSIMQLSESRLVHGPFDIERAKESKLHGIG